MASHSTEFPQHPLDAPKKKYAKTRNEPQERIMKRKHALIAILILVLCLAVPLGAGAHSGRTDANGGHKADWAATTITAEGTKLTCTRTASVLMPHPPRLRHRVLPVRHRQNRRPAPRAVRLLQALLPKPPLPRIPPPERFHQTANPPVPLTMPIRRVTMPQKLISMKKSRH